MHYQLFFSVIIGLLFSLQSSYSYALDFFSIDNWKLSTDFNAEFRFFPLDDKREHTKEQSLDFSTHLKADFESDLFIYKFAGLARIGAVDDARNVFLQEENFISKEFYKAVIKAGYQIHTWNILEGFVVADVLNSKNLDGDYDLTEKYGEITLSCAWLAESYTLSIFYFPRYSDPYWPKSTSRMSPVSGNKTFDQADVGNSIWVEGDNIAGDSWGHQGAVKFNKAFEELDLDIDFYAIHHMDRSQPFLTVATDQRLRGHHFRVTQYGSNISKMYQSWIFKLETAYRDFNNDKFQAIIGGPIIHPKDHAIVAGGFEKNITLLEGISSTLFMEYQRIVGIDFSDSPQYSMFQNDIFIALRSEFNDVYGKQLTVATFIDLDKKYEYAFGFSYSQRFADSWKILIGGRIVNSRDTGNPNGLELFKKSDQVYTKITMFY